MRCPAWATQRVVSGVVAGRSGAAVFGSPRRVLRTDHWAVRRLRWFVSALRLDRVLILCPEGVGFRGVVLRSLSSSQSAYFSAGGRGVAAVLHSSSRSIMTVTATACDSLTSRCGSSDGSVVASQMLCTLRKWLDVLHAAGGVAARRCVSAQRESWRRGLCD